VSATTVLVPVDEPEAEALLEGGEPAPHALDALKQRARTLRARVGRVDAVRDALHELLVPLWKASRPPPPRWFDPLARLVTKPAPAPRSTGYDPFVQLWGRSLPLAGSTPEQVAARLQELLPAGDEAFDRALAVELRALHPQAEALWASAPSPGHPGLDAAIDAENARLRNSLGLSVRSLDPAYQAIVRLSAWSQPIWRLDGELLPDLLRTLGATVVVRRATPLFEGLFDARPELRPLADNLPKQLGNFDGAGGWLGGDDARSLVRSLRVNRLRVETNLAGSDDPESAMREVRLLEEALLYCEKRGLALAEAAGVEWRDSPAG